MSTLDAYQGLTLLFGLVVLYLVIVDYKGSVLSTKWAHLKQIFLTGLPLLFAGYATIVTGTAGTRDASMYKNLILILGIGSIVLSSTHSWEGASPNLNKWSAVAENTSFALACGALYAVPIAYFSFK